MRESSFLGEVPMWHRLFVGTLIVVCACEPEIPPPRTTPDAATVAEGLDAGGDFEAEAGGPAGSRDGVGDAGDELDGGAQDTGVHPGDSATDGGDAGPGSTPDASQPQALCTEDVCCLSLKEAQHDTYCDNELCGSQGRSFKIVSDDPMLMPICYEHTGQATYTSNDGMLTLIVDFGSEPCAFTDGDKVRRAIKSASAAAVEPGLLFSGPSWVIASPELRIIDLRIENQRLKMRVEGPGNYASTISSVGPQCYNGGLTPIGLCNCIYEGQGPMISIEFDLAIYPD
jgi:hypothetical protein